MSKRICVVGAGRWGRNHIKTLDEMACLGGIVETQPEILAECKTKYPGVRTFSKLADAVEAGFDGFTIATPAETHFELAEYLVRRRFPVMVEKPMTLTAAQARKLNGLAEQQGVNLMVGHVLLFHPAVTRIKELIDEGKIGRLQYLYSNRLNLGTVRTEENILWSFAPHDISIFQYFIGRKPTEVLSRGGAFLQPGIQDTTMTVLTYPDNVVGHIFVSWLHPFKEHRLIVIGSKGMLSFEDSSGSKEILYYEKGIDWVRGEPIKRDGPTESIPYEKHMPLQEELTYFADHLDGRPIKKSNGANGVEVLEILEQATCSLRADPATTEKPTTNGSNENWFAHETACVDDDVEIGSRTKIWHYSHVQSGARIGEQVSIGQNVNVGNNVKIGSYVKIQNNVSVYEGVELEDYVFCGPSMVFTNIRIPRCKYPQRGSSHYVRTLVKVGASIGANATIVCGNTIGRHAFVAAGAVVTTDVPDYAIMVGVPARQKGWACECGAFLPPADDTVACPKCDLKYALQDGRLQPLV